MVLIPSRDIPRTQSAFNALFEQIKSLDNETKAEKTYQNTVALTPEDVSEAVWWVSTLPAHVNINTLEMMPVTQSYAGLNVHRQ